MTIEMKKTDTQTVLEVSGRLDTTTAPALDKTIQEEDRSVTFRLSDEGIPFDPLKKPDPDITLSLEERQIGGLGIFIVKKTMDSVSYAYENGKNILTMIKKI